MVGEPVLAAGLRNGRDCFLETDEDDLSDADVDATAEEEDSASSAREALRRFKGMSGDSGSRSRFFDKDAFGACL